CRHRLQINPEPEWSDRPGDGAGKWHWSAYGTPRMHDTTRSSMGGSASTLSNSRITASISRRLPPSNSDRMSFKVRGRERLRLRRPSYQTGRTSSSQLSAIPSQSTLSDRYSRPNTDRI